MLSSISLTSGKRPSSNSIRLPSFITNAFHAFLLHQNLDIGAFTHVNHDVFAKKKKGKNIVRPKTYCLIGNFNCSSSLCFNQFHQILIMSDFRISVIKFMKYWKGSTLVEAIDAVINLSKSIIFQIHRFILSIDGYH